MIKNSCYLCGSAEYKVRPGCVRDNAQLKVLECADCGLVYLSSFGHIHEGFYEESNMHGGQVDMDAWLKETAWDDDRRFNYLQRAMTNKSVLDFGCGNGGFLYRANAVAHKVCGVEAEKFARQWISENKNIDIVPNLDGVQADFDLITLFHVLEHFSDPRAQLKILASKLKKGGELIVEVPNADDALFGLYNSEAFSRFSYWSCHLFLFTQATLALLAKQAGLTVNYVKQVQRYPLSNHLHWLAESKPGGHQKWAFLDSEALSRAYETQLASIGRCDTILASLSVR